jgi:hypothetical protein
MPAGTVVETHGARGQLAVEVICWPQGEAAKHRFEVYVPLGSDVMFADQVVWLEPQGRVLTVRRLDAKGRTVRREELMITRRALRIEATG